MVDEKKVEASEDSPKAPAYEPDTDDHKSVQIICAYKREAQEARVSRQIQSDLNYNYYHYIADVSHKKVGQSQEFLPKQAMAVEQITEMLHQGLLDFGDWFSVEATAGNDAPFFTDEEARKLMKVWLHQANFYIVVKDAIKSALLGSLMIFKVGTKRVAKPKFVAKRKKALLGYEIKLEKQERFEAQCDISLVRPRDWYPDPTGDGLYEVQRVELDYHKLVQTARDNPDEYDVAEIERLGTAITAPQDETALQRSRETGQNAPFATGRLRARLLECWGTLVDPQGNVLHENCVATIANESYVIRRPALNPFWHQRSPFVSAPLLRVPWSVWHKCLMDAPTMLNRASNELFNLILDSGLASVFGIKQVRPHWILNAEKLSGGFAPNDVYSVNPSCPPGAKAVETVTASTMSQEALSAYNMLGAEFNTASLTNDLRMGVLPSRSVKATEVVESSNSITGTFGGVSHAVEISIEEVLNLVWQTMMQYVEDFEHPDYVAILGPERASQVNRASAQKRFALTVDGHKFRVFGLTQTQNKMKDFRKITTFMQTVAASPTLMDEFTKENDPAKLLKQIMKSLDIDPEQIKLDDMEKLMAQMGGAQGAPQGAPNGMSQVAPASAIPPQGAQQAGANPMQRPNGGELQ